MYHLITDVQKEIISYLQPKEIIRFYHCCEEAKQCITELSQQVGFIVVCKVVVSKRDLKWFRKRNISLQLYQYCVATDFSYKWFKNHELHRENDLPAFVSRRFVAWYQNGKLHRENHLPAMLWQYRDDINEWYDEYGNSVETNF